MLARGLGAAAALSLIVVVTSCRAKRPDAVRTTSSVQAAADGASLEAGDGGAVGTARVGMVWIPPGTLRAGTPPDRLPRVAEEELPGTSIAMTGFYIDELPFPNEAGAIPSSNVTRTDAQKLCEAKGKRLCSELEWERACKGPDNTTYEYGDTYRANVCGTGVPIEQGARRPSGDRVSCKSAFGVMEMHGGVWEWTDSPWGRGTKGDIGVLRGGNAVAGELVGRCANALGRAPTTKSATMGFRCCAGPRNGAENDLVVHPLPPLERSLTPKQLGAPLVQAGQAKWGSAFAPALAWAWHPVANEEIVIATGCGAHGKCGVEIGRVNGSEALSLAEIDSGVGPAEVVQFGDAPHLRMRGLDVKGSFLRTITYAYGRVEIGDPTRH